MIALIFTYFLIPNISLLIFIYIYELSLKLIKIILTLLLLYRNTLSDFHIFIISIN